MAPSLYPGVAVVTGAASGIGRAVACAFVEAGCSKLAMLDVNHDRLAEVKNEIEAFGSEVDIVTCPCDISDPSQVETAFDSIVGRFTRIDYLVNCAGFGVLAKSSVDLSVSEFDSQMNVNCRGVWMCSRAALKVMNNQDLDIDTYPELKHLASYRAQRGSIVNISSVGAIQPMQLSPGYNTSKGAVSSMSMADAKDFAPKQIRVNAVLPGVIKTPMTTKDPNVAQMLEQAVIPRVPNQRWGHPEEIADVVIFLSGNKASLVTGSNWIVDGGYAL